MRFILKGPDIPEELLRAHEEGRVAFFCGAGISMGAGLPDFGGLVDRIYKRLCADPDGAESEAIAEKRYDTVLGLLERRLGADGRMRRALAEVLSVETERDSSVHKDLLSLSRSLGAHPGTHLITTNFDRLFENQRNCGGHSFKVHAAPALPVPKPTVWDSLVYIHGLLDVRPDDGNLATLVATSGDFGNAYLRDAWAARFVTELFRNFVVCFVGYSLGDPVMRYLTDAIAADHLAGENANPAFIFLPDDEVEGARLAEPVHIISYSKANGHRQLYETLHEWAKFHEIGLGGQTAVIDQHAGMDPKTDNGDGFAGRVLWAVSEGRGVGAARFANHDPLPPFGWVQQFAANRGLPPISPKPENGEKRIPFLPFGEAVPKLDARQKWLLRWLAKHWRNPGLVEMVLSSGSGLAPVFQDELCKNLDELERDGENPTGEELWACRLWRLILVGKVRGAKRLELESLQLCQRLERGLFDCISLSALRDCLTPAIYLERHIPFADNPIGQSVRERYEAYLDMPIGSCVEELSKVVQAALPGHSSEILPLCEQALQDGLDAYGYLEGGNMDSLALSEDVPSVEDHPQNEHSLHSWRFVVTLLRDAWAEIAKEKPKLAQDAFRRWIGSPHVIFRRLGLFAAQNTHVVSHHEWFTALKKDGWRLLWAIPEKREIMRLLATTSNLLSKGDFECLCKGILRGPSHKQFHRIPQKYWRNFRERMISFRMQKIEEGGRAVPKRIKEKWTSFSAAHPRPSPSKNQEEEFTRFISTDRDQDFQDRMRRIVIPATAEGIARWLDEDMKADRFFTKDNWKDLCTGESQEVVNGILLALARNVVNTERMGEALWIWREDGNVECARWLVSQLLEEGGKVFREMANSVADWSGVVAKSGEVSDEFLRELANRFYAENTDGEYNPLDSTRGGPFLQALNHPVGKITEALCIRCFGESIQSGQGICKAFRGLFERACNPAQKALWPARVVLAQRTFVFYVADETWTRTHLFPLSSWKGQPHEAPLFWNGFLHDGRLVPVLLAELKEEYLATAKHLPELGESAHLYCEGLVRLGLVQVSGVSPAEFRSALDGFSADYLEDCARAIQEYQTEWMRSPGNSGDERRSPEVLWIRDVYPFIHLVWPIDGSKRTPGIRGDFALLLLATRNAFPQALDVLRENFDGEVDDAYQILMRMERVPCIFDQYPEKALEYLCLVVRKPGYGVSLLEKLLDRIVADHSQLRENAHYRQLRERIAETKAQLGWG